jgi:hypothetical protein
MSKEPRKPVADVGGVKPDALGEFLAKAVRRLRKNHSGQVKDQILVGRFGRPQRKERKAP